MVESKEEVLVKEEMRPKVNSAAISPPIFLRWLPAASILCFFVFLCRLLIAIVEGVFI
jgi:hypothetical protein